jgi:hypothetical protein
MTEYEAGGGATLGAGICPAAAKAINRAPNAQARPSAGQQTLALDSAVPRCINVGDSGNRFTLQIPAQCRCSAAPTQA